MRPVALIAAVIAGAIVGVLADWLLKLILPGKPKLIHIVAGILACLVFAVIAVLPALEDDSNVPGVSDGKPPNSTTVGPTPTANAYELSTTELIGGNRRVLESMVVNLDGAGPEEVIVRWEYAHQRDSLNLGGVDVFAWTAPETWKNVLHLTELENSCGVYWGEFGVVNLLRDQTRQLVTWLHCGTGAFLSLEVYRYRGLGFMDRIYKSPEGQMDSETQKWMESVPVIVNEELYISHATELYQYEWTSEGLVGQGTEFDLGPNGVRIDFWMDETGQPQTSPSSVTVRIGQYVCFQRLDDGRLLWDTRIQYEDNGVLKPHNSLLFYAQQSGTCDLYLWGWER